MTGSDNALKRYQRRMGLRMGLFFAAFMFCVDVIGRSGVAGDLPMLSWIAAGPFSTAWLLGALGQHALGGLILGLLMSRIARPPVGSV